VPDGVRFWTRKWFPFRYSSGYSSSCCSSSCWVTFFKKAYGSFVSNKIGMKFGSIVFEVHAHRLRESDFPYDVTLSRLQSWHHFTQKRAATWWVNTKRPAALMQPRPLVRDLYSYLFYILRVCCHYGGKTFMWLCFHGMFATCPNGKRLRASSSRATVCLHCVHLNAAAVPLVIELLPSTEQQTPAFMWNILPSALSSQSRSTGNWKSRSLLNKYKMYYRSGTDVARTLWASGQLPDAAVWSVKNDVVAVTNEKLILPLVSRGLQYQQHRGRRGLR